MLCWFCYYITSLILLVNGNQKKRTWLSLQASRLSTQTLADWRGFSLTFMKAPPCSSTPPAPLSRPFLCLCHSLSWRFTHLWIQSANPHCDNSGISQPFHCAIRTLRRHRLLLQSLDTHAVVVKTRGHCGVLQDIEDVTECGPASAADQTDFCAVVLGLGRPFVCRVDRYGLQRSVLLCSVTAEVFASP